MARAVRMVITGGGTGGHIFPGVALAEALQKMEPRVEILYVGARGRLEERLVPAAGLAFAAIRVRGLVGMSLGRTLLNLLVLPLGFAQSLWHLARFRPLLVVGTGGYVAGPVVAAARLLGRPVAIHEQNVVPGATNRLLGRLAALVMVASPAAERHFPGRRVLVTGNPVRRAALAGGEAEPHATFRLLVLGGSQGARGLNALVPAALGMLDRAGLEVLHQAGSATLEEAREAYARLGFPARVEAFLDPVGEAYRWADLVVCRAGASTLAELAVNRRPAVLIPFPGAAAGHQAANARDLAGRGAAAFIEDRPESAAGLAGEIDRLRRDPRARREMAEAMGLLARPRAAEEMAAACLALAGIPVGEAA